MSTRPASVRSPLRTRALGATVAVVAPLFAPLFALTLAGCEGAPLPGEAPDETEVSVGALAAETTAAGAPAVDDAEAEAEAEDDGPEIDDGPAIGPTVTIEVPAEPGAGGKIGGGAQTSALRESAAATTRITCSPLVQNRKLRLKGVMKETRYMEKYQSGGRPTTTTPQHLNWNIGSIDIAAATCKTPKGWRLVAPTNVDANYVGLKNEGNKIVYDGIAGRGWGVAPVRVNANSVDVYTFTCDKVPLWWAVGQLAGLPIPARTAVSIGLWILSNGVPEDGTKCQKLHDLRVKLKITSSGNIRAVAADDRSYKKSFVMQDWYRVVESTSIVSQ
jgi:hypothetical protein